VHRQWVDQTLESGRAVRDDHWSEAIAVGSLAFIDNVKGELRFKAVHRQVTEATGTYTLREPSDAYAGDFGTESKPLSLENTVLCNENAAAAEK
jgi:putative transposase